MKNLKYIALGIITGCLIPYIYELTKNPYPQQVPPQNN